jgi:dihydrofolate reductase
VEGVHADDDPEESVMRKIFVFMMTSLDGYYAGPDDEIDWHNVDEEFNQFAAEQLDEVDTLLFGRVTYEGMASWWPTAMAKETDPIIAEKMNDIAKLVVSTTLDSADWANSRLIKGGVADELARLKQEPGKDIAIFGSSVLAASLLREGLLDEVRTIVSPVVLGSGKSFFGTLGERAGLELLKTRTFRSGNVLMYHRPVAR